MKFLYSLFVLFFVGQSLLAQDIAFSTLAVDGTCMIQRGSNPDEFVKVEAGVQIFTGDKVIVTGSNSYIALVAESGKVTEITGGGVYASDDLSAGLVAGDASLAKSYSNLMAQNLTSNKYQQAQYNMYTGTSVDRSVEDKGIEIFLPAKTKISDNSSSVTWSSKVPVSNYEISIFNLYEEVVYSSNTVETSVSIDFGSLDLFPGQVYRIKVAEVGNNSNTSNEIALVVPTRSELAKFQTDLSMLENEVPVNSAIGDMVMATYLEEQGLFLQAIPYYQSAISKEPKIIEYKHAYEVFLYKVGLEN